MTKYINSLLGEKTDAPYVGAEGATARSIISLLKGIKNSVYGALPAGTALIGKVGIDQTTPGTTNGVVSGASVVLSGSFTRPNDTTAYTANDQVADSTSAPTAGTILTAVRATGLGGIAISATLVKSTNVTTAATFRARLFSAAPTMANDNAAYSPARAALLTCLGHVDFLTANVGSDCVRYVGVLYPDRICIDNLAATTLYWNLQALGAYAPGAQEIFTLMLGIVQD